jgi:hypothetical protein
LFITSLIIIVVNEDDEEIKFYHEEIETSLKNDENMNNNKQKIKESFIENNNNNICINNDNNNNNTNNNNSKVIFDKEEEYIENKIEINLSKKNILTSLPLYVSRFFLNNWIEIKNICVLDSAFCNKQLRIYFLNILNGFVIGRDFDSENNTYQNLNYDTELYMKWISKRNILVKNLYICKWNESIIHYFQTMENNKNLFLKSLIFDFKNLENFEIIDQNLFFALLNSKSLKNVTEFYLINDPVTIISELVLIAIANNFNNLKVLDVSFSHRSLYTSIFLIAQYCNQLENINLMGNPDITDLSLIEIANSCKNLKIIKLDYCYQLTDDGIIATAINCLKLEFISLYQNENVTDFSLFEISKNCSNLKVLILSECFQISDNGIIAIANNALNLKKLILNGCSKITKNSLIYVAKKSLALKELDCYNDNESSSFCNLNVIMKSINTMAY